MGRMHSNGKGISASAIPYSRTPPVWLKVEPGQIVEQIGKLAKKGATPSQIGVILRDAHGITQVKVLTSKSLADDHLEVGIRTDVGPGNKILRILRSQGTVFNSHSRSTHIPACYGWHFGKSHSSLRWGS